MNNLLIPKVTARVAEWGRGRQWREVIIATKMPEAPRSTVELPPQKQTTPSTHAAKQARSTVGFKDSDISGRQNLFDRIRGSLSQPNALDVGWGNMVKAT